MPTRYLKPGIRDSELIDKLSSPAEVLFYRLIVTVDDFGRADGRPAMVKAACFPIKESATAAKCADLLAELARVGLIDLYEVDGKPYLQMQKWDNAPRAKESKFPAPADGCAHLHADAYNPRAVLPVTETETETGTDKKAQRKRRASFDASTFEIPGWIPRDAWVMWCDDRRKRGKPITEAAAAMQVKALEGYRAEGHAPGAVIAHSIAGGYQGLFPPKAKPGQAPAPDTADWRATRKGIEQKGVELGLGKWDEEAAQRGEGEQFYAYRARVERAAREQETGPADPAGQKRVADLLVGIAK